MTRNIGLYIHVPFCKKKCPYCNFYSTLPNDELMDKYVDEICCNLDNWSDKIDSKADTLYFGGGTPSLLGWNRLGLIIDKVKERFKISEKDEVTLELNPNDLSLEELKKFFDIGINRLSMGIQSFNDEELLMLGRSNSVETSKKTIFLAKSAGFDNISADLMIAIPKQSQESLRQSIRMCKEMDLKHVSAYILKVEKGTRYFSLRDSLEIPDEDKTSELYFNTCDLLEDIGMKQYEISNFAIPGFESKHNLKYWNMEEYLGLGPSAHSFLNGIRFFYKNSLKDFMNENREEYESKGGSEEEYAMLRLRLREGLTNEEYRKRFKKDIPDEYFKRARLYEPYGVVEIKDNDSIRLTREGYIVSNYIISRII